LSKFINRTIGRGLAGRLRKLNHAIENPMAAQEKILSSLIISGKSTKYFQEIVRSQVKNKKTFFEYIPLNDYNSLKPYIENALKGEKNVLWPGKVKWFAKSSGTTENKSKFIPVTKETLKYCHYKAGRDLLAVTINNFPETGIFYGSGLIMGGSSQINKLNKGSVTGDLSAILSDNLPLWTKLWQQPGKRVLNNTNWEEKTEQMARETIRSNITHITGVPTWTAVLFNKVLQITGAANIHEVWPNLEIYVHGGVSFEPYRELFKKYLPDEKMKYMETYNASEGFFGFQDQSNMSDMLLLCNHGIYYEFIPFNSFFSDSPQVIPLEDVKTGINYVLVISTNSGLWRYIIGDTLEFVSTKPYRFRLTGRTKHFINTFGEELIIDNADKAISYACEKTNAVITDYTSAPKYFSENSSGAHEWLIEFETAPTDIVYFTNLLDDRLKELNSDYEAKRMANLALGLPIIKVLDKGTFYKWMKENNKLGGQNKVPRLSNNRELVESILNFAKKNNKSEIV